MAASGCGTTTADPARGRVLFIQKCGVCHALAQAGTTAQIGPNLDDAFAAAREAGEDGDTIEGVVKAQVEYPRPNNGNPAVSMPADIVTGQDLDDVAAYVGECTPACPARRRRRCPAAPAPRSSPTTAAAAATRSQRPNSGGVTGPNLDEVLPGQTRGDDRRIDRRPERENRQGLPAERDAAELRTDAVAERSRRPGQVPDRKTPAAAKARPAPNPAAEPERPRRPLRIIR